MTTETGTRLHDMRHMTWGHNAEIKSAGPDALKGPMWSTPVARDGDRILWQTDYGHAEGTITVDKHCLDPMDMAWVTVEVQRRFDHSGAEVWAR